MNFAATRKNTGANIVNAGNAAGNALTSFLETSRQAAPDYTQLSALNIAAQSSKAATAVEAEAKVRANKIELEARTKAYDKVSKAKSDAERWVKKAGMLAGMGQLAIEATKKKKDPPPPIEIIPTKIVVADNEDIDKVTAEATKRYDELLQNMPKPSTSGSTTGTVPASSHGGGGGGGGTNSSPVAGSTDLSKLSEQDWKDLAFVVSGEAHPNSDDEYGVAASVLNRVASDQFPGTISDVIHAKGQYAAIKDGGASHIPELVESLSSETGRAGILKALEKLDGRTDFKGQPLLHNRSSRGNKDGILDPMFHDKGNFYHYAGQT